MKKLNKDLKLCIAIFITFIICGAIFSGCSTKEAVQNGEICYSTMMPNPGKIFADPEIEILDEDGGNAYIFKVTNWTADELKTYIEETRNMGFTDVSFETETDYGAYTEDGRYWSQIGVDGDAVIILCQTSREYQEE